MFNDKNNNSKVHSSMIVLQQFTIYDSCSLFLMSLSFLCSTNTRIKINSNTHRDFSLFCSHFVSTELLYASIYIFNNDDLNNWRQQQDRWRVCMSGSLCIEEMSRSFAIIFVSLVKSNTHTHTLKMPSLYNLAISHRYI